MTFSATIVQPSYRKTGVEFNMTPIKQYMFLTMAILVSGSISCLLHQKGDQCCTSPSADVMCKNGHGGKNGPVVATTFGGICGGRPKGDGQKRVASRDPKQGAFGKGVFSQSGLFQRGQFFQWFWRFERGPRVRRTRKIGPFSRDSWQFRNFRGPKIPLVKRPLT